MCYNQYYSELSETCVPKEANLYSSGPYTDGDIEKALGRHYSYINANMIVSTCTSMLVLPAL